MAPGPPAQARGETPPSAARSASPATARLTKKTNTSVSALAGDLLTAFPSHRGERPGQLSLRISSLGWRKEGRSRLSCVPAVCSVSTLNSISGMLPSSQTLRSWRGPKLSFYKGVTWPSPLGSHCAHQGRGLPLLSFQIQLNPSSHGGP